MLKMCDRLCRRYNAEALLLRLGLLKQKQAGLILIILGAFLFLFIFLFFYFRAVRIPGFPEFLPAEETAFFAEFPVGNVASSGRINELASLRLGLDWEKDIMPWAGERAALVFLKKVAPSGRINEVASLRLGLGEKLTPFIFLEVRSPEAGRDFLKKYPNLHSAFLENVLVLSSSKDGLEKLLALQSPEYRHLSGNGDFIKLRYQASGPIFVYVKPKEIPEAAFQWMARFVPHMPPLSLGESLAVSLKKDNNAWLGHSYLSFPLNTQYSLPNTSPYRALLLPYLQEDFDFFLAGQNLKAQIEKIDVAEFALKAMEKYLPEISWENEIGQLLSSEFALTLRNGHALFVAELQGQSSADKKVAPSGRIDEVASLRLGLLAKIRASFAKSASQFAKKNQEVRLPDNTLAKEFIPDPDAVKSFEETFQGILINGFTWGKTNQAYDAVAAGKWFISNDLTTLKKALLLTQEPGRNFRESEAYKQMLQPILANPELLGVARTDDMMFSFSKRMFGDHMETDFMLRL